MTRTALLTTVAPRALLIPESRPSIRFPRLAHLGDAEVDFADFAESMRDFFTDYFRRLARAALVAPLFTAAQRPSDAG